MDTYSMLKKEIRRYIYDQKWQKFTKIQEHSIKLYSESEDNLILIAPTASGKTEAAFLPAINSIENWEEGVKIVYISPLIALINDQFNTSITVVASDLVAAVDRASLMSHTDKNNIATLSINENRILLTGNSPEIGKVEEEITVENYEGASLDVSFNPDYLKDALRLFGSSEATIQFLEANRPFTLTLKDNHSDIPYSFIQLVTPVRTFNG